VEREVLVHGALVRIAEPLGAIDIHMCGQLDEFQAASTHRVRETSALLVAG
jgi:hypothetical protein